MNFAILGAGCFWCVEAIFSQLNGVTEVISGYTGGKTKNPTYKQVCSGNTNHVEVCKIFFDPKIISFKQILKVFWKTHDPTTLNRQGDDKGTQYKSAIFYINNSQKKIALEYKKQLENNKIFDRPIVTEIVLLEKFYKAENYHQNYYSNNSNQSYCKLVIKPKLDNFLAK